jgi:transposase
MSVAELRAAARRSADARQASRILAIAMVLHDYSREEAARLYGMDRQSLRDWVHRYNKVWMGLPTGREAVGPRAKLGAARRPART